MAQLHVYDKAKYHEKDTIRYGLPDSHAANHTVMFLRWSIEKRLISRLYESEQALILRDFMRRKATIFDVYNQWDRCFTSDMLSDEGNRFAMHYFEFSIGKYASDYQDTLAKGLQSIFHVTFDEENYQKMKAVIDQRYSDWLPPRRSFQPQWD